MFKMDSINVPVLGLVENMSYFTSDCRKISTIFWKNGGKELAENMNIELLAQIPLVQSVGKLLMQEGRLYYKDRPYSDRIFKYD